MRLVSIRMRRFRKVTKHNKTLAERCSVRSLSLYSRTRLYICIYLYSRNRVWKILYIHMHMYVSLGISSTTFFYVFVLRIKFPLWGFAIWYTWNSNAKYHLHIYFDTIKVSFFWRFIFLPLFSRCNQQYTRINVITPPSPQSAKTPFFFVHDLRHCCFRYLRKIFSTHPLLLNDISSLSFAFVDFVRR